MVNLYAGPSYCSDGIMDAIWNVHVNLQARFSYGSEFQQQSTIVILNRDRPHKLTLREKHT